MCAAASAALLVLGSSACGSDDPETNTDADHDSDADLGGQLGEVVSDQTTTTTTAPALPVSSLTIGSVAVPAEAPEGNDACQPANRTSFGAGNLTDSYVNTAWRMSGDASGQELTITLDGQHNIRQVGLVPGYAKVDPCDNTDRFFQNRRVLRVTWTFDDGTTVAQDLRESPEMQSVGVTATSTTVRLRIDSVSGDGGKDFTALSEIGVRGN